MESDLKEEKNGISHIDDEEMVNQNKLLIFSSPIMFG